MVKGKWLTVVGLLLFGAVVIAPPLVHGYVYPNMGDDSAGYLAIFDSMKRGIIRPNVQYMGYVLTGYPMTFASNILSVSVDTLFLWFNYVALIGVGLTLYFVASRLVNWLAGWIALLVVLFCAQSFLFQFYYGQIYNLINIGIILPWLVYFTARYLDGYRRRHLVAVLLLVGLFAGFHTSGVYLPAIVGISTVAYVVYAVVKKRRIERRPIVLGGGILAFSVVAFAGLVAMPTVRMMMRYYEAPFSSVIKGIKTAMVVPLGNYMMDIVSPSVLILVALLAVHYRESLKSLDSKAVKTVALLLLGGVVVLGVASFARLSLDPWRQALDLASVFAVFTALMVGLLLKHQRSVLIVAVLVVAVGFGLWHNLPTWFSYTSAVRPVDREALAYADRFKTYSVSGTIAPWIYSRFTEAEWVGNEGEVVLVRSKPMTPRSTLDNIWYQAHGWTPDNSYELTRVFSDGDVVIEAYEVTDFYKAEKERAKWLNY